MMKLRFADTPAYPPASLTLEDYPASYRAQLNTLTLAEYQRSKRQRYMASTPPAHSTNASFIVNWVTASVIAVLTMGAVILAISTFVELASTQF